MHRQRFVQSATRLYHASLMTCPSCGFEFLARLALILIIITHQKLTNTQGAYMQNDSLDLFSLEMLEKSAMNLERLISLLEGFLARLSASPEQGEALRIQGELSSLISQGLPISTNLVYGLGERQRVTQSRWGKYRQSYSGQT